jgi:hypothetical protein
MSNLQLTKFSSSSEEYYGYILEFTDGITVKIGVSLEQRCCECVGIDQTPIYKLSCQSDLVSFIDETYISSDLHEYEINDEEEVMKLMSCPTTKEAIKSNFTNPPYDDPVSCCDVNVKSSLSDYNFTMWNHHNGYYGHEVAIIVNDKVEKQLCI